MSNSSSGFLAICLLPIALTLFSEHVMGEPLKIGAQGSLASLDPHVLNETFTIGILSNVMEGLVRRDAQLRIKPGLATKWQRLSKLHWRFHLRRRVRFHDGSPFSADDVVFSLRRAGHARSQQKLRLPKGMRVSKVDPHTVDIRLATPHPDLPSDWEPLLIMSAQWARRHGMSEPGNDRQPASGLVVNGTGPYRVTHHKSGATTRFALNAEWWGTLPQQHFNSIDLHTVNSAQTRTAALLANQVDLIVPAPLQDLSRIAATTGFRKVTGPELRTIFLNMDQQRDTLVGVAPETRNPLRDIRVRRAIYHAIDVQAIARVAMRGNAVVASSLVSPIVHPDVNTIGRLAYSPKRARALLREAGYRNGFVLPMDCPSDRYVNDGAICTAIAAMLARVGIRVPLNIQTKSLFFAKVLSGGGYNSAFNLIGWTPGTLDGRNVLTNIATCRDAKGRGAIFNLGGYCNPRVDRLAAQALNETDAAKRRHAITEALRLIHSDAGFIPLHQQMLAWAMSDKVDAQVRADNQIRFNLISKRRSKQALIQTRLSPTSCKNREPC